MVKHLLYLKVVLVFLLIGMLAMLRRQPDPTTAFQAMYQYSWIVFLYASLMIVALLAPASLLARLLRSTFLRGWGRISYCVYLIHLGILASCHLILLQSLPRISDWPGVLTTMLAAGLTWLLAQLSWRYFEKPLLDRGHRSKYAPVRVESVQGKTA
jgi:peptidoglycan/LPS O-acetylase OafA/YrhL